MPFIVSRHARIHYELEGDGPAIFVLSHLGSSAYQCQLPAQLRQSVTLVFVDLAGTGLSTGSVADLTLASMVGDLEALREALGLRQVYVFGHSMLGILAVEYAWRCPGRVRGAVMVCTPPMSNLLVLREEGDRHFASRASVERKARYRARVAALTPTSTWRERFDAEAPRRYFDDTRTFASGSVDMPAVMEAVDRVLRMPEVDWDIAERGESRQSPLFVATGRHDYVVPAPLWEERLPHLRTATYRCFERSGHQPFVEEPERFVEELVPWMQALELGDG